MLRGPQRQAKVIRDGWSDHQSLKISPPFIHPYGRAPSAMGAGAWLGARPNDNYRFLEIPGDVRSDVQIEEFVMKEALNLVGLDPDNPLSPQRQQQRIEKFLQHAKECLKMAYKAYVLWGDPELEFRVTGQPEPLSLKDSDLSADLDVSINFDSLNQDPENMRNKVEAFLNLMRSDATGRFSQDDMLEVAANMIDPSIADQVLKPIEEARNEILKKVAEDLALIWSGQSVGAQPNGAQIAIEYIQQYAQKQSIQQRIAGDPDYAEALQTYVGQYEFQLQQQQNAVTGRIGTEPAELQGVNTQ